MRGRCEPSETRRPQPAPSECERAAGRSRSRLVPLFLLLACTFAATWVCPARAQLLNLDAPEAPAPGEGKAVLSLIARIDQEIAAEQAGAARLTGPAANAAHFQIEMRRLARDLLDTGEKAGEAGSISILTGRTLFSRIGEIDAHAAALGDGRHPALALVAEQFVRQMEAKDRPIPTNLDDLDRFVRDALAMLVEMGDKGGIDGAPVRPWIAQADHVGWVEAAPPAAPGQALPPSLGTLIDAWAKAPGVSAQTIDSLRALDTLLAPANHWWAYSRTGAALRSSLAQAGAVTAPMPAWISQETHARLIARFDAAARQAADRTTRADALTELARLALVADLVPRMDRLAAPSAATPTPSKSLKPARESLLTAISAADTDPSGADAALAAFDRALDLLAQRATLGDDSALAREVKVAWRTLEPVARHAEDELLEALGRMKPQAQDMSDPGVVGALAGERRAIDDLASLRAISDWLGTAPPPPAPGAPGPAPQPAAHLAAARLTKLGQDVAKPDRRDAALRTIQEFGDDLVHLLDLPGEAALRAAVPGTPQAPAPSDAGASWKRVTGGKDIELLGAIDAARAAWLDAWGAEGTKNSAPGKAETEARNLRLLRRLMSALGDASVVAQMTTPDADGGIIQAWPGWELSGPSLSAILKPAQARLATATDQTLKADAAGAAKALADYESSSKVISLAAALERAARQRALLRAPVLVELCAPPTPASWLIAARADLAAVCRYADEYFAAAAANDPKRADNLLKFLNTRADAALAHFKP